MPFAIILHMPRFRRFRLLSRHAAFAAASFRRAAAVFAIGFRRFAVFFFDGLYDAGAFAMLIRLFVSPSLPPYAASSPMPDCCFADAAQLDASCFDMACMPLMLLVRCCCFKERRYFSCADALRARRGAAR